MRNKDKPSSYSTYKGGETKGSVSTHYTQDDFRSVSGKKPSSKDEKNFEEILKHQTQVNKIIEMAMKKHAARLPQLVVKFVDNTPTKQSETDKKYDYKEGHESSRSPEETSSRFSFSHKGNDTPKKVTSIYSSHTKFNYSQRVYGSEVYKAWLKLEGIFNRRKLRNVVTNLKKVQDQQKRKEANAVKFHSKITKNKIFYSLRKSAHMERRRRDKRGAFLKKVDSIMDAHHKSAKREGRISG